MHVVSCSTKTTPISYLDDGQLKQKQKTGMVQSSKHLTFDASEVRRRGNQCVFAVTMAAILETDVPSAI